MMETIYEGLVRFFGFEPIVWLVLFVALIVLLASIVNLDFYTSVLVCLLPVLLFATYQTIFLGAYGIAAIVIILGFGLSVSIYRLFMR